MVTIHARPPKELRRWEGNLQKERDGAAVYAALAQSEKDPNLARVYAKLAAVEEAHAEFWKRRIIDAGHYPPEKPPGLRSRMLVFMARRFGAATALPIIAAGEARDSGAYAGQPEALAAGLAADEQGHARVLRAATTGHGLAGSEVARIEGRHRSGGGNALRAAVLGANDGLVSNLCLVMGVAGAAASERVVLLTGLAGLVAGACSMAMGEWLSVNSSRELYQSQIAAEAEELAQSPDEEKAELALIYQAKGLDEAQAKALADRLLSDTTTALETLTREELGIDPKELGGSPWTAAGSSFVLFAIGAIFPIVPYFFLKSQTAFVSSLVLSGVALAAIGAGTSLFTGRGAVFSAIRQLLIGLAAAAVTYGAGALVGASLS
ncbi:MAG: VIT1/CCC1 transporter family protein [Parcubacteria group bacterium]